MDGMGRDCGSDNFMPFWICRNKYPASIRAFPVKGGVVISPCIHTIGLSFRLISLQYVISDILSTHFFTSIFLIIDKGNGH